MLPRGRQADLLRPRALKRNLSKSADCHSLRPALLGAAAAAGGAYLALVRFNICRRHQFDEMDMTARSIRALLNLPAVLRRALSLCEYVSVIPLKLI